jgi:hypothetical protein
VEKNKCPAETRFTLQPCGDPDCLICNEVQREYFSSGTGMVMNEVPGNVLSAPDPLVAGGQGRSGKSLEDHAVMIGMAAVVVLIVAALWMALREPEEEPQPAPRPTTSHAKVWLIRNELK